MEGKARIAVIAVGEAPLGLSYELEKRGIVVFQGDIASVEELVEQNKPHLIALVGIRGAMELSTLLEDQDRNLTPRVAVIAARRDLSRLWGLNRDVVISLLATEMGDKVVAGRLEALARQAAKKRGEIIEGPPPMSLSPRGGTDAFTTVAPQAVAAIQLVKQAQAAQAGVTPAIEINASHGESGDIVDELDSASLESDRPPDPEAPLPSPSLLVTHLGLGLKGPGAELPRADGPLKGAPPAISTAGSFDPDITATFDSVDASSESAPITAPHGEPPKPIEPFLDETRLDPRAPDLSKPGVSPGPAEARVGTDSTSSDSTLTEPGLTEPGSSESAGTSPSPDAERGSPDEPLIDTESLIESLRLEQSETAPGAGDSPDETTEAPEPAASAADENLKSDHGLTPAHEPGLSPVDHEPDSDELTRPGRVLGGKTVLGLGMRNPAPSTGAGAPPPRGDERQTMPGDFPEGVRSSALGAELEADFFRQADHDTPPSGTPAFGHEQKQVSQRPSSMPRKDDTKPDRRVPALLLTLLATAAVGGAYMNARRQEDNRAVATSEATKPAAPSASPGAPASQPTKEDAAAPSEPGQAEPPSPSEQGLNNPAGTQVPEPGGVAPDKPADPRGAPETGGSDVGDPKAAVPTGQDAPSEEANGATSAPDPGAKASGLLSDELLRTLLLEPSAEAKSCQELVPNPKQGVRDPAAEGSVPWQAARKAIVRGDLPAAQTNMCEAAFINPASPALEALALLYVNQGAPNLALEWLDKAEKVRPNVRDTLDLRGTALTQLGKIEEARSVWLKALSLQESDLNRRKGAADEDVAVARQYLKQGDLPRAERRLRRAVVLDPSSSIAMATLAEVMVRRDRLEVARAFAENAVTAEPYFPDAYVVLADVATRQRDFDKAKQNLERALQIRPDFWPAKKALRELNKAAP